MQVETACYTAGFSYGIIATAAREGAEDLYECVGQHLKEEGDE